MDSAYQEFAGLLALSALIGAIALRLRQPLIVAFIISGIMVEPSVLGWVSAHGRSTCRRKSALPSCCSWSA